MKIIGGHDYYDINMQYGMDKSLVFVRNESSINTYSFLPTIRSEYEDDHKKYHTKYHTILNGLSFTSGNWRQYKNKTHILEYRSTITVYFCGKRYTGFKFMLYDIENSDKYKPIVFYSFADFKLFLQSGGYSEYVRKYWSSMDQSSLIECVLNTNGDEKYRDLLAQKKLTIAIHDSSYMGEWHIDAPLLKTIQFYKVFPANLAYQEIEMWLGSALAIEKMPPIKVSEKIRLEKRGFDSKFSFRKEPTKTRR